MKEYIRLLRDRSGFRNLWLATVVSLTGDWFNTIASIIIVNRYTDSGLAISWILIARALPRFVLGPVVGVVADRFNRKTVMVVSDILRAGIVLCFLFVDRAERVWLIYLLTTLQFILAAFYDPASSAMTPSLLKGEDELLTANVLRSVTWSAILALGAALGGEFAFRFGVYSALVADSITYLVSAYLVMKISLGEQAPSGAESGWLDFIEGLKYILERRKVAMLTLVKAMGQIGTGDIIMAIYAKRYFTMGDEGARSLGIMFAAAGLGAVLGPTIAKNFTEGSRKDLLRWIQYGFIIVPPAWWLIGRGESLWIVSLGFMFRLMGVSINWTFSNVLIQMDVPDNFLGRVFAFDLALFTLASSTSIFLTGYFLDMMVADPRGISLYFGLWALLPVVVWGLYLWGTKLIERTSTP